MSSPQVYLTFPGNAREALNYYQSIFGGELKLFTLEEFNRTDGPATAIAHGELRGPVPLAGSDATGADRSVQMIGIMFSLLGTSDPATLHQWFDRLADGGTVNDPLAEKPWGASDGQVTDKYGLRWLIGYEHHDTTP